MKQDPQAKSQQSIPPYTYQPVWYPTEAERARIRRFSDPDEELPPLGRVRSTRKAGRRKPLLAYRDFVHANPNFSEEQLARAVTGSFAKCRPPSVPKAMAQDGFDVWLSAHFMTEAYQTFFINENGEKDVRQVPKELRERPRAVGSTFRLKKLEKKKIYYARINAALAFGFIPRRRCNYGEDTIVLRWDIDGHNGEPDVELVADWINSHLLGGMGYFEPTRRGTSIYAVVSFGIVDDENPASSSRVLNAALSTLHNRTKDLIRRVGFKAEVEVLGRFQVWDKTTKRTLEDSGEFVRMPRCPSPGDFDRLRAARVNFHEVQDRITRELRLLPPIQINNASFPQSTPGFNGVRANAPDVLSRAGRPGIPDMEESDDMTVVLESAATKHQQRVKCMSKAVARIMRDAGNEQNPTSFKDAIIELADQIYCHNNFNGGERDRDRNKAWSYIFDWMAKTYRACDYRNAGPNSGQLRELRFDLGRDIERASQMLRSLIPDIYLQRFNDNFAKSLNRTVITHELLAFVLCTMAMNVFTAETPGEVPVKSCLNMLGSFGHRFTGSGPRLALWILESCGLVRCTDTSYQFVKEGWIGGRVGGEWFVNDLRQSNAQGSLDYPAVPPRSHPRRWAINQTLIRDLPFLNGCTPSPELVFNAGYVTLSLDGAGGIFPPQPIPKRKRSQKLEQAGGQQTSP